MPRPICGINGWLLVLCYQLVVFTPLLFFLSLDVRFGRTVPLIIKIDTVASIVLVVLGCIGGVRLVRAHVKAVATIKLYLSALIFYNFVLAVYAFIGQEILIRKSYPLIFISIMVALAWYAYLQRSERVKNTITNRCAAPNNVRISQVALLLVLLSATISLIVVKNRYQLFYVPTQSMQPTIRAGGYVLVKKTMRSLPQRGDIVVFTSREPARTIYVKRCIAISGDSFAIKNNHVYVNTIKIVEPYAYGKTVQEIASFRFKRIVPRNTFIALGDNREHSHDSRHFGYVEVSSIKGIVVLVL